MKKFTCIILSFLIFATPLFAIMETVYDKNGRLIGYIEQYAGNTYYYDRYKKPVANTEQSVKDMIQKQWEFEEAIRRQSNVKDKDQEWLDDMNRKVDNWNPSFSQPQSNQSKSYKICPISYCKHKNSITSKYCSECAYSLEGVSSSSQTINNANSPKMSNDNQLLWIIGIFIVGKLLFDRDNDWKWDGI